MQVTDALSKIVLTQTNTKLQQTEEYKNFRLRKETT